MKKTCYARKPRFFTELPSDRYGGRAITDRQARVVEAKPDRTSIGGLLIVAPDEKEFPWRTFGLWLTIEVSGPARTLTEEEYLKVLEEAKAKTKYIEAARHRIRK